MLAWLHAVPEGQKKSRYETEKWPLPECGAFSYVAKWFIELRMNYGYQDIAAWASLTGTEPNPIELQLLMTMSSVYSNNVLRYRDKGYNLHPPYEDPNFDKSEITRSRLSSLFGD